MCTNSVNEKRHVEDSFRLICIAKVRRLFKASCVPLSLFPDRLHSTSSGVYNIH